jgi:Fur family transcriptional regulator, ferric uptake regulator
MPLRSEKKSDSDLPGEAKERKLFESFLATRHLRLTRPRKLIFDEVFRIHGHVDAEEIALSLRTAGKRVSRASVYRTLDLLAEANFVKPVTLGSKQRFYEHVHTGEHHDHLVCQDCGKIFEFYSGEIEDLQTKICSKNSFEPVRHTMTIYGRCGQCRKKNPK